MDMVVLSSNEEEGSNVAGITGWGRGVAGEAEGATSGIGSVEGTAGAGALVLVGVSMGCGSSGCCGCGISGCSSPAGAPGSTP